ncbi:hypothetical protein MFIFM68171_04213 [Madurella fahalii]|uniref:Uncharacterized protein n=1 Tax=Madurella fahalii TaxID=1157608 RepID=A0ABQ0G8A4_9PEZI
MWKMRARAGAKWEDHTTTARDYVSFYASFRQFQMLRQQDLSGDFNYVPDFRQLLFREIWFREAEKLEALGNRHAEVLDFWRDYERFDRSKIAMPADAMPNTTCIDQLLLSVRARVALRFLVICSGILYASSRLNMPWTRFLPKIS